MYFDAWRKYFDFLGVATRSEYWSFTLINIVISVPLSLLAGSTEQDILAWARSGFSLEASIIPLIAYYGFILANLIPTVSLTVRRVRDATGSGWFVFLIIPILGIAACPARNAAYLDGLTAGYWNVWEKSADYLGVAKRVEFWPFTLINLVAWVAVVAVTVVYLLWRDAALSRQELIIASGLVFFALPWLLTIPWVPLAVRRVRDATGTGWIALVGLIPFPLGQLALLVVCLFPTRQASDPAYSGEPTMGESQDKAEPAQYDDDDPWARGESGRGER